MVLFTNDYGVTFGPHEILGFCKPDSFLCPHRYPKDEDCGIVFLDSDAYWFPDRLNQLTLVSKGGQQWVSWSLSIVWHSMSLPLKTTTVGSFTLPPCQQYTRSSRPNRWAARCLACGIWKSLPINHTMVGGVVSRKNPYCEKSGENRHISCERFV